MNKAKKVYGPNYEKRGLRMMRTIRLITQASGGVFTAAYPNNEGNYGWPRPARKILPARLLPYIWRMLLGGTA